MEQLGYGPNFNIALHMSLDQLKFYCVRNELFKSICSNQEFWLQRLRCEYSSLIQYKPEDMTYGQYYTELAEERRKFVDVFFSGNNIGKILTLSSDRIKDVANKVYDLFLLLDYQCDLEKLLIIFTKSKVEEAGKINIRLYGSKLEYSLKNIRIICDHTSKRYNLWKDFENIEIICED
jgi:hypothetical protein